MMGKRIFEWYLALGNTRQVGVLFMLQFTYWAICWFIFKKVWPDDEPFTWPELLFQSTWMALWMTTMFHWKKVKLLFKKKQKDDQQ